jgi:predicted transposase YdaD
MAKRFDATTKFLVELNPTDWLRLLGLPLGPTAVAEADLSTVSTAADRLVTVESKPPYALLTEFQGNTDPSFEGRLAEYAILAKNRLELPVCTVAVLLRPFGGHGLLRGRHVMRGPDDELLLDFRYRTLRIWTLPPEVFLAGGLAVLPLATIAKVRKAELPRILDRIDERLDTEATPANADLLRTATFVLMGLKFDKLFVEKLMSRNVLELSATYQALQEEARASGLFEGRSKGLEEGRSKGLEEGRSKGLEEGRAEEARRLILRLGERRFGTPTAEVVAQVTGQGDPDALEAIADRLLSVETWQELLADA